MSQRAPARAPSAEQGPEDLQSIPGNASVVAYANVRDVMTSDLRRRLKDYAPHPW